MNADIGYAAVRRALVAWSVMDRARPGSPPVATFWGPGARTLAYLREAELNRRLAAEFAAEAAGHLRTAAIWRRAGDRARRR